MCEEPIVLWRPLEAAGVLDARVDARVPSPRDATPRQQGGGVIFSEDD